MGSMINLMVLQKTPHQTSRIRTQYDEIRIKIKNIREYNFPSSKDFKQVAFLVEDIEITGCFSSLKE